MHLFVILLHLAVHSSNRQQQQQHHNVKRSEWKIIWSTQNKMTERKSKKKWTRSIVYIGAIKCITSFLRLLSVCVCEVKWSKKKSAFSMPVHTVVHDYLYMVWMSHAHTLDTYCSLTVCDKPCIWSAAQNNNEQMNIEQNDIYIRCMYSVHTLINYWRIF